MRPIARGVRPIGETIGVIDAIAFQAIIQAPGGAPYGGAPRAGITQAGATSASQQRI